MANSTLEYASTIFMRMVSDDNGSDFFVGSVLASTWVFLRGLVTWDNFWKLSALTLILVNLKVFPFIYHLRILNAVRFVLRSQRPKRDVTPEQLFQPLITSSKACLMEIDVLGHKSNSTYFADTDVARAHLITTMFGNGIAKIRGSTTMNGLSGKPSSQFTVALGAVSCTFKKELSPYETYDMWTRILSWDDKWVYIVTHFVTRGSKIGPQHCSLYPHQDRQRRPKDGKPKVASPIKGTTATNGPTQSPIRASTLSKIVFKNGRITIRPQEMLEASNLLPKSGRDATAGGKQTSALREAIEAERLRGLQQASLLANQIGLENEFRGDVALGRHYDGFGIEGVVATLAQLGKLSPYQLI
ncbi:uncharacterized protein A1O5_12115 [Cladophialophora psammophila CBS 110553]|uniref:Capsule polysaccharide biosynthesis protein n=1 Tax=Cladophialophora psammophila CBS 110553 TaxID=1182543 RepID=W9W3B4_9EURO|nr:uncharacterized protein A1O5_12115 [Cladophialophora psammophila CBS 110553]EXJ59490.1 hypothetical protein A1O5_12115 [Cladophialophora psammophila CBS 110553]